MKDAEGVEFLQWCLPRLHLQWSGFRKVRRQVYKKLRRRLQDLNLPTLCDYRSYLDTHSLEWRNHDEICRIPISRFYRDKGIFEFLEQQGLPQLAQYVMDGGERIVRCWSIVCASGEEPYTLAIIWRLCLAHRFPELHFEILATDIDPDVIERAKNACSTASCQIHKELLKEDEGSGLDVWFISCQFYATMGSTHLGIDSEYVESVTQPA